jgi:hypothetical protein
MLDFTKLDQTFAPLLRELIINMKAKGHSINPYYGLRTLTEQAKIWRRSRSTAEVNSMCTKLEDNNCPYALSVLKAVGPQKTAPWGTNTYMFSYHLVGKAADMFVDGDMAGGDVYDILAKESLKIGLTPGRYFSTPDSGHVQLGSKELSHIYTMAEMDVILRELNPI